MPRKAPWPSPADGNEHLEARRARQEQRNGPKSARHLTCPVDTSPLHNGAGRPIQRHRADCGARAEADGLEESDRPPAGSRVSDREGGSFHQHASTPAVEEAGKALDGARLVDADRDGGQRRVPGQSPAPIVLTVSPLVNVSGWSSRLRGGT